MYAKVIVMHLLSNESVSLKKILYPISALSQMTLQSADLDVLLVAHAGISTLSVTGQKPNYGRVRSASNLGY